MTTIVSQLPDTPQSHRFTREEYYQMADAGVFQDQRVELIEGEIIDMSPQKDFHAGVMLLVLVAFQKALPELIIRPQLPLHLGAKSEPEPDISVVDGTIRERIGTGHPTTALLVVEIADTTLRFDRGKKASLYARAGIKDYWIINLVDNCLEVMRQPAEDPAAPLGWKYRDLAVFQRGDNVSPLVRPESRIAVADLLP
jgi:Uma2 family endonuclease